MPKINIHEFSPEEGRAFTLELKEPTNPKLNFSLRLRSLTLGEQSAAVSEGSRYFQAYGPITQAEVEHANASGSPVREPIPLPPIGNKVVPVTLEACELVALIEAAQVETDPSERYSFTELITMTVFDGLFLGLNRAAREIQRQAELAPKTD